jgi:hypothetical protein
MGGPVEKAPYKGNMLSGHICIFTILILKIIWVLVFLINVHVTIFI